MPYNIGFKIDSLIENPDGSFENDEWSTVTQIFKLSLPSKEVIEIIPVTSKVDCGRETLRISPDTRRKITT